MALLDLLKSLSTKHLKAVIRLHNLHEHIKLGQPREALINDLINHFDILNTNTLVSKIHELTIPQTVESVKRTKPVVEAIAVVKRKLSTPITKRIKAIVEEVIEEEPVKRDLSGLISSLKSIRDVKKQGDEAKADLQRRREAKQQRDEIQQRKEEALKALEEEKKKVHEEFLIRTRKQRAEIQQRKEEALKVNVKEQEEQIITKLSNNIKDLKHKAITEQDKMKPYLQEHNKVQKLLVKEFTNKLKSEGITLTNARLKTFISKKMKQDERYIDSHNRFSQYEQKRDELLEEEHNLSREHSHLVFKYNRKYDERAQEPKPKADDEDDLDEISHKLQQLIMLTPTNDILKALEKLNFKGKVQSHNKMILSLQLVQNFNTIEKMKSLINVLE